MNISEIHPEIHWQSQKLHDRWISCGHDANKILDILQSSGSLPFPAYSSGLFPASALSQTLAQETGYGFAWIRDNCHIANALWQNGDTESAVRAAMSILEIFQQNRDKLDGIARGIFDPEDVMMRPPARVVGDTLAATGKWANAQNDAIGYALWFLSRLVDQKILEVTEADRSVLAAIVRYLDALSYWKDNDNGHWEEARKNNASSIGAVLAGLEALEHSRVFSSDTDTSSTVTRLIDSGRKRLNEILPNESISPTGLERRYDAALLFLVEPLRVVTDEQAHQIVADISENLLNHIGIARYPGDSYWSPDYRQHFGLGARTADFSEHSQDRDNFSQIGSEAQWTLFDSLLSVYWGRVFEHSHEPSAQQKQLWHLERSLAQFIDDPTRPGAWQLPEAYCLENGEWIANDEVPLLWSQANLLLALRQMIRTG